jgi:hypothetical protein
MPVNVELAGPIWLRYEYLRDNGHNEYIDKADKCEQFFRGMQWSSVDIAKLQQQRRPALTINKILSTLSNVMGEQIFNRTDISFQPRSGAPTATAEALSVVYRQIMDNNQWDWRRSDMFCDGIITSRGFVDARLDFTDSMMGEVRVTSLNPKNVLIDADADQYDPDEWNDVSTTKWMTWEDIAILYNEDDANLLKDRNQSWFQYGFDSIERTRDRFGPESQRGYFQESAQQADVLRNIRVIEQQKRRMANQKHLVDPTTGDMRAIPDGWDRNKIAHVATTYGLNVVNKLVKRIRWTVIADNVVLHDDWSPFEHFTVVPFFPYFRRGKTIGLVENLLGPQELLNKVTSQELHVVNTTANSGWKVKEGSLKNLTLEELEQRGAETGLVMSLADVSDAEKILPNQVPTGLDRVSYKAEEHIKSISGVSDYQTGSAREDVSAKAVQENLARGSLNQAKSADSLNRTDYILARNVLSMVQRYYTEERLVNITKNRMTGEQQSITINQPTPEGVITNDLTIGEYDIVVTNVPHRQTLEAQQFDQAVALREQGVPIPDEVLIAHSALFKKDDILKKIEEAKSTPDALHAQEVSRLARELELGKMKADVEEGQADAVLKNAKARKETLEAAQLESGAPDPADMAKVKIMEREAEIDREIKLLDLEIKKAELLLEKEKMQMDRQKAAMDLQVKEVNAIADTQIAGSRVRQQEEQHQVALKQGAETHKQKLTQTKQVNQEKKRGGKR